MDDNKDRPFVDMINRMIAGELPPPGVATLIGFSIDSIGEGTATATLETDERHSNPMGTLHGGILCDLADAAMGIAWASGLSTGESFTTLELKINYFKPVWKTTLLATARIVKRGRTVGMVECDVTDPEGSLVARVSSTVMTLRGENAKGR